MLNIVTYSYLLFPLLLLLIYKVKPKDLLIPLLALYGIMFFCLIHFDSSIPRDIKKYHQAFYTFIEYAFFTGFIWMNIKSQTFKKFIAVVTILFLIFEIYFVTTTTLLRVDSTPVGIETILIFIYIFYFFFEFSKHSKDFFIYNHYTFWLSVGIMVYLGGSFFLNIFFNHLDKEAKLRFANVSYVTEIIKNILFIIAAFIYTKFPINNSQKQTPKNIPNLDMNMI